MKFLVLLFCVVASSSAGYANSYAHYPIHIPVIGPNGVPVDTPEVQHARAAHYAALAQASVRSGHHVVAPVAPVHIPSPHANDPFYGLSSDGRPLDTPEVASAKLQHQHDYAAAAHRNGVHHFAGPVVHSHAAAYPVDTPEVQLAKAAHFAAHAAAKGHHYRRRRGIYPQHIPVIGPGGVPVDTPEVQHARAAHLAALAAAGGHSGYAAPYYAPVPVLSHNSLPADTPEVQHAKAAHFAAHAAARAGLPHHHYAASAPIYHEDRRYYGPQAVIGPDGHPVETPEVQLAKAAHFAAYSQALTHHY